nr:MAG TPA: hypothetical protein [Caudoviricetes sp.]
MTTFIVSMLVIVCIVAIARYYGSSSMASNLLLTLAFSVVVGLGIQFATKGNSSKKENTKIENSIAVSNPASTQSVCTVLEPVQICHSGAVSQIQDYKTVIKEFPQLSSKKLAYIDRIAPPFPDSS